MTKAGYQVVLKDASLLDLEEMKQEIPPSDVEIVQPGNDAETHNELATIFLITISVSALTALTMWLLRKYSSEVIEYKVTVRNPDRSEIDVYLKLDRRSSEAPEAQVIKQI